MHSACLPLTIRDGSSVGTLALYIWILSDCDSDFPILCLALILASINHCLGRLAGPTCSFSVRDHCMTGSGGGIVNAFGCDRWPNPYSPRLCVSDAGDSLNDANMADGNV